MTTRPALDPLRVRAGDRVTAAKWNALVAFVERLLSALGEMVGPGLSMDTSGEGFYLRAESQSSAFSGAFFVTVSGLDATIARGTVGGIVPAIGEKRLDADPPPTLSLKLDGGPGESLRSWVAVRSSMETEVEPGAKPALDKEDTTALQMVHVTDLDAKLDAGAALLPVALILWTDRSNVSRAEQIVYFNQALDYYPSSGDFVFHPAA